MQRFLRLSMIFYFLSYSNDTFASLTSTTLQDMPAVNVIDDNPEDDPLEGFNRAMTFFNDILDGLILSPAAELYDIAAPDPLKESIHNVLSNLATPYTFINDVLQGETERAGNSYGRFMTNTVFGLGGIFDVATDYFNISSHTEDLGQTLAVWGADDGAYLVLPIFGPSTVRDAIGIAGGFFLDPATWLFLKTPKKRSIDKRWFKGYTATTALDRRTRAIPVMDYIHKAEDPYIRTKSLYRQNREFEIKNGVVDYESPTPDNDN